MKKIITLFITVLVFAGAKAQNSSEEARRVILGYPKTTNGSGDSRDVVLGRTKGSGTVNYPERTSKGKRDHKSHYGKKKKVKCGNGRKDNGNHYGWTIGKGNRGKKH